MEVVTVQDAIRHIEVYVKLQNYRFDDAIHLDLDIDPALYDCGILKLLIQPIVENSILHGILEKEIQTGTITITGRLKDQFLSLTITDNGIGMTQEQIDALPSSGYGIKNVIHRIKLYYGESYGLTYRSTPGNGTSVLLWIPCITPESQSAQCNPPSAPSQFH